MSQDFSEQVQSQFGTTIKRKTADVFQEEDDLVITELQPTLREMPSMQDSVVLGNPDLNDIPVFIEGVTFDAVNSYFFNEINRTTQVRNSLEQNVAAIAGYHIDSRGRKFVRIVRFIMLNSRGERGQVDTSADEWRRAYNELEEIKRKGEDVATVLWWHDHPGFKPAPSDLDERTALSFFSGRHQPIIISNPNQEVVGLFGTNANGVFGNKGGVIVYGPEAVQASKWKYCHDNHM